MTGPKIVTLDIETFPIVAYVWGLWDQNVGLNQIAREWSVASVSYKWLGSERVEHYNTAGDPFNDSALLEIIWHVLDEADIVIAQNGIKFDAKKINARLIELGFEPPSPYKIIDTMVEAKKAAQFTSNKLEWLSGALTNVPKSLHKEFPGFELWLETMKDNPLAWREMQRYNDRDILATEALYIRLRPWIKGHPNLAAYDDEDEHLEHQCPNCLGTNLEKRGFAYTQVGKYQKYKCLDCGAWSRSRYTLNSTAKRQALLTN